jgi:hypothetical protein
MLLGHSTFAEISFGNPRLDAIHNVEFGTTQSALTFTIGTETVTGSAPVDVTTAGAATFSIGDEDVFGTAFQNLISFSTGSPDFFVWNETDDSQSVTWKDVEPGSSD